MVDTPEDMPSTPADTPEVTPAVRPPTVPAMLQLLEARVFLAALITARRSNCSSFVTVLRFWSRSTAQQLKWARPKWDSTAGPSPAARAAAAATKRGDRPMRATRSSAVVAPGGQSNVEPRGATAIDAAPVASACALQPRSTQAKVSALPLQMEIRTVLKSRVAMLREKLLQKRQDASLEQDVTPASTPQSEAPPRGNGEAATPVESFLAEGSNRHALQTLAEQMARRADKLGPPPEVDLPRAQLGDEMLDDFMSRACRGKKDPPLAATNGTNEMIPKQKKAKKRKKRKENSAALESNVFLQAESDSRHWQPSEPAEASPEPASAEPVPEEDGQAESVDGIEEKPKKSKKRRDKNKKAKVKSDGSNEPKRSKKAAGKSIQVEDQKVSRQRKDTKKASSRKVTKEESGSEGSSEEERKAKARKAEERCARERERRAEEAARRRERRAEHSRERRERSAGRAKRQDRSRHRSRSRRRSVSRTRERSQRRRQTAPGPRRGGRSRSRSGSSGSASGRRGRGRSRSRGNGRRRSSSSGGSRGEASNSGQPEEFKPFSRVVLLGLQVNKELNGLCGLVAPSGLPTAGDLAGAYKVRLETGREVAARLQNLEPVRRELSPGRLRRLELVEERLRAGA